MIFLFEYGAILICVNILRSILRTKKSLNNSGNIEIEPIIKKNPGISHLLNGIKDKLVIKILLVDP